MFPVVFALESALYLWLKQLEKMFIFRDSHGATTNFLEKLLNFRDSHAKSDHFPDIQKDSRITSSDLQSN